MITVTRVLGRASELPLAEELHRLEHEDGIEFLVIDQDDMPRRRLRCKTDRGTDITIALGSGDRLIDGAVLLLDKSRAIVVRVAPERWLRIKPLGSDAALEAGYCAGNHHWRVRFEPGAVLVAMHGPADDYLSRLDPLLKSRKIEVTYEE